MRPLSWVILLVATLSLVAALLGSKIRLLPDPSPTRDENKPSPQVAENKTYVRFADDESMNGWYAQFPGSDGELLLIRLRGEGKRQAHGSADRSLSEPRSPGADEG